MAKKKKEEKPREWDHELDKWVLAKTAFDYPPDEDIEPLDEGDK